MPPDNGALNRADASDSRRASLVEGRPERSNLLRHASYSGAMVDVEPLSNGEEALWRAMMRIIRVLPRHLDSDLLRNSGLTASDYTTMMVLSETPKRELRMSDLANANGLSA